MTVERDLLAWYAAHARALPWRSPPGWPPPEPYFVWLSEVMLQQTTAAAVAPRFIRFIRRWPTLEALAAAPEEEVMAEWAGLGYYARARALAAAARQIAQTGLPATEAGLRTLPGVGEYTAAAIAAIAFGEPTLPVDANIARVGSRLLAHSGPRPALRRALAQAFGPPQRPADLAQALMDLGRLICTPRRPRCPDCPVAAHCAARTLGTPEAFPPRTKRAPRPSRRGVAFWLEAEQSVLLVRRPRDGLLGGMPALPSSAWEAGLDPARALQAAPAEAPWRLLAKPVRHVFTHFALDLSIAVASLPSRPAVEGAWVPTTRLDAAGLPTLFKKAARAAQSHAC